MRRRGRFHVALGVPFSDGCRKHRSRTEETKTGMGNIGRTTGRLFGVWVFFSSRAYLCTFKFTGEVLYIPIDFLKFSVCLFAYVVSGFWRSCCGLQGGDMFLGALRQIFGDKAGGEVAYFMEFPLPHRAP